MPSLGGKEKWDISWLITGFKGGKVKEEGFEGRDGADIEALRECERV